jgi:hypothetical protein
MIKIKAGNARKTQSNRYAHGASFSMAIAKFPNAEIDHFRLKLIVHVLIRDSLTRRQTIDRDYASLPEWT